MSWQPLISVEYLYNTTILDENIDGNLLHEWIVTSQDINIQQLIGNNLYVKLMNDVATNTLTGAYYTLVTEYLVKCQAKWITYYAMPYLNFRMTNKAVSEKSSDYSNPTTLDNIKFLRSDMKNQAEFYAVRTREYIVNNRDSFPEYFSFGTNMLQLRPKPENYFNGIWLPRGCNDCGKKSIDPYK